MMTWRKHSLSENAKYCVTETFRSSTDSFENGEILTFVGTAYSAYDGMTGFRFISTTGEIKAFDVPDNDQIETWTRRFERISEQ